MKGMIFTEFMDMVDDEFGLAVKDPIICKSPIATGGAYTFGGSLRVEAHKLYPNAHLACFSYGTPTRFTRDKAG